ncbi:MAG TPA: hypothetical protein VNV42_00910 [Solirubrobacteraceae bacterium]|nr:hypothetical protein [Solirubrobacteraceae bacterium]
MLAAALTLACSAFAVFAAVLPSAALAEEACPNAAFRTGPSAALPDCRAYELLSPPFKNVGHVYWEEGDLDGSSGLLNNSGAIAGLEGFPELSLTGPLSFYSTSRTASGWTSVADDPPSSQYQPYLIGGFLNFVGASEDGQTTVFMDRGISQPENGIDFFMRRPDRSIVDVGPALPPTTPPGEPKSLGEAAQLFPAGVSSDASHVFFTLGSDYWPGDGTQQSPPGVANHKSLYEYVGVGNTTPMLVGVSDGSTVVGGKTLPAGEVISPCGIELGSRLTSMDAVSTDGDTVFFTAQPGCGGPVADELFARIDNGLPDARTVAISEPTKEDCSACDTEAGVFAPATFEGASEDGSKVFFWTRQPLLGGDTSGNLYEYDFDAPAGERVALVSAGDATVSGASAEVLENARAVVSQDGSHVYFLAQGVLTKTPNGEGESAVAGALNLYVFERDSGDPTGSIAFVAQLSGGDLGQWEYGGGEQSYDNSAYGGDATPDGRFLVFTSDRDLTPDDSSTASQVFEYDAQTGALVRVSIGQDGFNHNGNVSIAYTPFDRPVNDAVIATPSGGFGDLSQPGSYTGHLSVSADGSYVFFQSTVGLTPQAINERVIGETVGDPSHREPIYANNVYEYHAGRVSLISDGQDLSHLSFQYSSNVHLISTDPSGRDVIFTTADQLVGQDADTAIDIYDARVDGGFPAPVLPPSCSGDACQGALSAAPTLLSPGSEFQAGGNPPLVGQPAAKPKAKTKPKKAKAKKNGKAGARRVKRRVGKAMKAAVGGRANRKAGR